ncbi:hypothetical protein BCR35DRAFT_331828 [Leucosporidium creatinivorum]|uniref:BTB domain-containing protein n=1 Tax=Leucosporidium creatinivorum TaxID=106004 RepID=A0A1Y2FAV8_9BASI|nr:hypothetical protein BCR35DRAFT_331828 [Leucosporidium creatinivorum]
MSQKAASPAWDAPPPFPSPAAVQPPAPSLAPPEQYTVITRGVRFHLSRSQIEYDSPNYFTSAFLEHDFAEAASKVIYLDRNPQLFALIVEHLSGYKIFPFQPQGLPACMSPELARGNLLVDAEYLGLEKLRAVLRPIRPRQPLPNYLKTPYEDTLEDYLLFCGLNYYTCVTVEMLVKALRTQAIDKVDHFRALRPFISHEYIGTRS